MLLNSAVELDTKDPNYFYLKIDAVQTPQILSFLHKHVELELQIFIELFI